VARCRATPGRRRLCGNGGSGALRRISIRAGLTWGAFTGSGPPPPRALCARRRSASERLHIARAGGRPSGGTEGERPKVALKAVGPAGGCNSIQRRPGTGGPIMRKRGGKPRYKRVARQGRIHTSSWGTGPNLPRATKRGKTGEAFGIPIRGGARLLRLCHRDEELTRAPLEQGSIVVDAGTTGRRLSGCDRRPHALLPWQLAPGADVFFVCITPAHRRRSTASFRGSSAPERPKEAATKCSLGSWALRIPTVQTGHEWLRGVPSGSNAGGAGGSDLWPRGGRGAVLCSELRSVGSQS